MKKRRLLPAACSLALIASVCLFIGYATDTLPQLTQRQKTAAPQVMTQKNETEMQVTPSTVGTATDDTAVAISAARTRARTQKPCHCCEKTVEKLRYIVTSLDKRQEIKKRMSFD